MNNKNQIYPKTFIVEFAAIVFLIITIPVWLPIAISILVGGFGILVLLFIIGLIFTTVARSDDLTSFSHYIFSIKDFDTFFY